METAPHRLYVAISGSDDASGLAANPGGGGGPLRTLEGARNAIRGMRERGELPPRGVTVELLEGRYELHTTFRLDSADSGKREAPIVYRAAPGREVRLAGSREVSTWQRVDDSDGDERIPEEARGHVVVADLGALDIADFGDPVTPGQRLELFFDGEPMPLARWPNEGFATVADIAEPDGHSIHGIEGSTIGKLGYEGDRPSRWVDEPQAFLHGYWFWDWADAYQAVDSLDPANRVISLRPPYHHYGYRKGQRFYALNVLSELDQPGEWYLDRERGLLYLWPPSPAESALITVSVLPTLVSMEGTEFVRFEGLVFEEARGTAITVKGGTGNGIERCTIRNTGSWAARIDGGVSNRVAGCEIYGNGEGGIVLSGGDRPTLTPARNEAVDNDIHHYGRIRRTYTPAVGINGVGNRVAHNLIHDGPHNAIQLSGNDHLIEFNEIHTVCWETGDVGAFYMGRDWSMRGTIIRHNYFHDIRAPGLHGAMAVYLDDAASGIKVLGNVFVRAGRAAFIGGGRDNLVENNVFVDCEPSVHIDDRGLNWMRYHIEDVMPKRLEEMPYREPPWSERYPELLTLIEDDPGAPKGNVIRRNISVGGRWLDIAESAKPLTVFEDNLIDEDPLFVDAEHGDFRLRPDSPAPALGFQPIPLDRIGVRP